ncbi:MAG: exodeoxyribonuclease I [Halioglobus sp.]
MRAQTFYWHDYETFGANPARDRPVQFAGIRTDAELNVVGEPVMIYSRPANDFLPHPGACLVTGITPQLALEKGVPECEFIARIHEQLSLPGTCGVGYNSLRFDDEVTRYTLYRNFFDPYAREWQNGNSRWDIIDMLRTACALRPQGIIWPEREDGLPSFKLEDLTVANGIAHEGAHDALADVHATIAMARLVREKQPKLYSYLLEHRDKKSVLAQLDIDGMKPLLHVSGMFGARRNNIALIVPIAIHPVNSNEVICWDLGVSPELLVDSDADTIRQLLYSRSDQLPEDVQRPGLKSVHINRCPVLLPAKMADPETAQRLGMDGAACRAHLAELRAFRDRDARGFQDKVQAIYRGREFAPDSDPDTMLYGGGFFSEQDKRTMAQVRSTPADELGATSFAFEDKRLPEMLFRYRARNYLATLSPEEHAQWEEFRFQRLTEPDSGASLTLESFHAELEERLAANELTPGQREVLLALQEYADGLLV